MTTVRVLHGICLPIRSNHMGAWGHGSFDNDDACDLACDLTECTDLSIVEEALRAAINPDDYLEAPEAGRAVAAAEVVLALLGQPTAAIAEEEALLAWVKACNQVPSSAMLLLAQLAVQRVQAEDCELRKLKEESDSLDEWMAEVNRLQEGLRAACSVIG